MRHEDPNIPDKRAHKVSRVLLSKERKKHRKPKQGNNLVTSNTDYSKITETHVHLNLSA